MFVLYELLFFCFKKDMFLCDDKNMLYDIFHMQKLFSGL